MNSVGLPKGVQLIQGEGGGNPSQRNYITNDFVSVRIAQNKNVLLLLLWVTYCCCENETFFFLPSWKFLISVNCENVTDQLNFWHRGHSLYLSMTQSVLTVIWQTIIWIYHAAIWLSKTWKTYEAALIVFYLGGVEWKWHSAVKTDLFFLGKDKFESNARLLTLLNHDSFSHDFLQNGMKNAFRIQKLNF